MIEDVAQLIKELKEGQLVEHRHPNIELKPDWQTEYGKKISGLANRLEQGVTWFIVGVSDDGSTVGHDEAWAKRVELIIAQQLNDLLNPSQAVRSIECHDMDGAWIVVLKVQPPGAVTYWSGDAYKGAGTSFSTMTPVEVVQLTMALPGLQDYSAQKWSGSYDAALVQKFGEVISARREEVQFGELTKLSSDEILQRLGIKDRVVSQILFGDFRYRVVYYNADGDPVENRSSAGLFGLLTTDFIQSVQRWGKKGFRLTESSISAAAEESYPIRALREGIANAVAHAAYFEQHGDVLVEVYPDKLVISNLCLPEAAHFANKWFSRSRNTINRLLMEVLRIAGYVDELGRGKNLLFSESLKAGKRVPIVEVEKAGQFSRWRLHLYGGVRDEIQLRLLGRLRDLYKNEHKAMVASALVLWSNRPVSDIAKYIDGESKPHFQEIISDINGPVFFYEKRDELVPQRWVRVLLEEGKDSKALTVAEEEHLRRFVYDICGKYQGGIITPKELRKLAHMGETRSEKSLTSTLLRKWVREEHVEVVKYGVYRFKEPERTSEEIGAIIEKLLESRAS